LLAAFVLGERAERVVATDILPEALAAVQLNRDRMVRQERIPAGLIEVTRGGDLFDALEGLEFDLILFNAPWVTTPARSRPEVATHDGGQEVLRRFLEESPRYLTETGSVLLEYSDHSGPRALENLIDLVARNGWTVRDEWKRRVQARRKSPRWENIFVYHLIHDK
jgi:methylase of polypeptide subunit release factors